LRRLVGKFDRTFKQTDRNCLYWVRRQEQTEGRIRTAGLSVGVELLLKSLQEIRHELDVLEEDPMAFSVTEFEVVKGNEVLTITERNSV
jgi:hypothetical protein